ncbi:MAG: sugar phosphate isomerase/epimerase [Anaerolineae bacterium]|nr:sugar phosphate isomerase/epimerase [Anaerolineae bacterium]
MGGHGDRETGRGGDSLSPPHRLSPSPCLPFSASPRLPLAIVLSTHPAQFQAVAFRGDLEANLRSIAGLGYDGVELAIRDPGLVDVEALSRTLDQLGLAVPAVGTGQAWAEEGLSFTDPDASVRRAAVDRIRAHLAPSARWGAVVIVGLIRGTVFPGVEPEQAWAWLVEALRECCRSAADVGVRLALEPINRYETVLVNTVAQGLDLVTQVGAPNLGLLLDTFHMNIEEPSIERSIRAAGERIFHFHVADSNRWYPGAGHLNFPAILAALAETGYGGYVSGEFLPLPDPATAAASAIRFLRGETGRRGDAETGRGGEGVTA